MDRYVLEIEDWIGFDRVGDFRNRQEAIDHGSRYYPQNDWIVRDSQTNRIVFHRSVLEAIAQDVQLELDRFAATEAIARKFERMRREQQEEERRVALNRSRHERLERLKRHALEIANWKKEGF